MRNSVCDSAQNEHEKPKSLFVSIVAGVSLLAAMLVAIPAVAAENIQSIDVAQDVSWNLSASVMPGPPYGTGDLPGSDTSSSMTVKLASENSKVKLDAEMNGLLPNQIHTAILANDYVAGTPQSVNVGGGGYWEVAGLGALDLHFVAQNPDGSFTGWYCYPSGGPCTAAEDVTGTLIGNQLTLTTTFYTDINDPGTAYTLNTSGTVQPNSSIISNPGSPVSWTMADGAVQIGFPGPFNMSFDPVLFTTDENGSAKWSMSIKNKYLQDGPNEMSVWITNGDSTHMGVEGGVFVLISDNFTVTK